MIAAMTCVAGPAVASGSTAARAPRAVASTTSTLLTGVSCASATFCFAVGATYFGPNSSHEKPVAERWNGKAWSIVPTPVATGAKYGGLTAVSCATMTDCVAVGSPVEHWNGKTWSIVHIAKPAAPIFATLSGVTCTSTTFCIAVGLQAAKNAPSKTLIERWNGATWSVAASPNPHNPGQVSRLDAVSCIDTTHCFAVGSYDLSLSSSTLVERWNGRTWSIVASPSSGGNFYGLAGVSCPSATMCIAVGTDGAGPLAATLAVLWNGTTWSRTLTPGRSIATLAGVSCASPTDCFAVGNFDTSGFGSRPHPTAEHWDGSSLSIVAAAPQRFGTGGWLTGASCSSSTDCVAVGQSVTFSPSGGYGSERPMAEQWNGTTWSTIAAPIPG